MSLVVVNSLWDSTREYLWKYDDICMNIFGQVPLLLLSRIHQGDNGINGGRLNMILLGVVFYKDGENAIILASLRVCSDHIRSCAKHIRCMSISSTVYFGSKNIVKCQDTAVIQSRKLTIDMTVHTRDTSLCLKMSLYGSAAAVLIIRLDVFSSNSFGFQWFRVTFVDQMTSFKTERPTRFCEISWHFKF